DADARQAANSTVRAVLVIILCLPRKRAPFRTEWSPIFGSRAAARKPRLLLVVSFRLRGLFLDLVTGSSSGVASSVHRALDSVARVVRSCGGRVGSVGSAFGSSITCGGS